MNENNPPRTGFGKVARTPNDNTRPCRLTRTQFNHLSIDQKIAEYFAANVSRKAQADIFNNPRAALESFANTLKP